LLLMTAATRAPYLSRQLSRWAVFTMAAMLEPPPEIKMTMFFIPVRIMDLEPGRIRQQLCHKLDRPLRTIVLKQRLDMI
jgi:hypothetical protein